MIEVDSTSSSSSAILEATLTWADVVCSNCGTLELFDSISAIESSYPKDLTPTLHSSALLTETPSLPHSSNLFVPSIFPLSSMVQINFDPSKVMSSGLDLNSVFTTNSVMTPIPISENIPVSPQCPDQTSNISVLMQAGIGLCVCIVIGFLLLCVMNCCKKRKASRSFSLPLDIILTKPRGPAVLEVEQEPDRGNTTPFTRKGPIVLPADCQLWQRDHRHLKFPPNALRDLESADTECESISFEEITTTL